MNQIKFKIPKYDKYTNYFLSALLFVIDYLSIVLAEQSAFVLRNWIVSDGGTLHISWLNFWVVFPLLYLLFLNIEQLYNRNCHCFIYWSNCCIYVAYVYIPAMAVQFHIFNCISLSYQKVSRESTIVADSSTYYWCRKNSRITS